MPHRKDRSRAQEEVVSACLELDQPRLANDYIEGIVNWRKGDASAELALYCVQHGAAEQARTCLETARKVADDLAQALVDELEDDGVESPQDWQRDRIRSKMAKVLFVHGEPERAEALEAGLVESEAGKVDAARARVATTEDFEVQMVEHEAAVLGASFERARRSMEACVELFDRFYDDTERRARAEAALRVSGAKLPEDVLIDLLRRAAEVALVHGDQAKAVELVKAANARVTSACGPSGKWIPEQEIAIRASLVGLRFRTGDREGAAQELAAAASLYEAERANIADFDRAGALRSLAEAACEIADRSQALATYVRAVEEGAQNPNARPRAEDLAATCCSMARRALGPDAPLWQRMRRIRAGLGQPW
jgi:hypothetical protein